MNDKHKYRRLNYLCTTQGVTRSSEPFSIQGSLDSFDWYKGEKSKRYDSIRERIELLKLFQELGFTDEEAIEYWFRLNWEQRKRRMSYYSKPIPVKKDNPNTYGEKFIGGGTKRQPRKCRKSAWKRFKKLFPDHNIT